MNKTRMTLDYTGSQIRAFNNWLTLKLSERDEKNKKKYRQKDVAEYIGITEGEFSNKMAGRTQWSLVQALNVMEYFDTFPKEIFR